MIISLYIHIPFCKSKCEYCDFYSIPIDSSENSELQKALLETIVLELNHKLKQISSPIIETIFIGGGTPSAISPELFNSFLSKINSVIKGLTVPDIEFSTEANIESCSKEFMDAASSAEINRLSLGVQSFNPEILENMGRALYPDNVFEAVSEIRSHWQKRLSFDLISGITTNYSDDIKQALKLNTEHLSVYQLTVEEGTPLFKKISEGQKKTPDENLQTDAILNINRLLSSAGFNRYEISNYCLPGAECKHNLRYWNMQSYLGVGPAAVSSLYQPKKKIRTTNIRNIAEYIKHAAYGISENYQQTELLTDFDFLVEHYLMGCRLINGLNEQLFSERFGCSSTSMISETIEKWSDKNLISPETGILNEKGSLFLDSYLSDVYDELHKKYKKLKKI